MQEGEREKREWSKSEGTATATWKYEQLGGAPHESLVPRQKDKHAKTPSRGDGDCLLIYIRNDAKRYHMGRKEKHSFLSRAQGKRDR
jgi:hypothetical protein